MLPVLAILSTVLVLLSLAMIGFDFVGMGGGGWGGVGWGGGSGLPPSDT